jgi:hypothetical protein
MMAQPGTLDHFLNLNPKRQPKSANLNPKTHFFGLRAGFGLANDTTASNASVSSIHPSLPVKLLHCTPHTVGTQWRAAGSRQARRPSQTSWHQAAHLIHPMPPVPSHPSMPACPPAALHMQERNGEPEGASERGGRATDRARAVCALLRGGWRAGACARAHVYVHLCVGLKPGAGTSGSAKDLGDMINPRSLGT